MKPIAVEEFLLHVYSLLDTRFLERRLKENRHVLEGLVKRSDLRAGASAPRDHRALGPGGRAA